MHGYFHTSIRLPALARPTVIGVFATTVLGGCIPIAGTLNVQTPLKLAVTDVFKDEDSCAVAYFDADCERHETRKQTVLNNGRYKTALDMSDRSAFTLSLTEHDNTPREIRFSVPRNLRLPEKEGRFTLLQRELGQPVDVRGNVSTTSTHSSLQREQQFCSYDIERWVCPGRPHGAGPMDKVRAHRLGLLPDGRVRPALQRVNHQRPQSQYHTHKRRHEHGPSCGWRTVRVQGSRQSEFFLEYETRAVALDLLRPGTQERMARFEGAQTETHKHFQRLGGCF